MRVGQISVETRLRVFARDGWKCVACGLASCEEEVLYLVEYARRNGGKQPKRDRLTVDHIVPRAKGGASYEWNLRTLCARCNNWKGDALPTTPPERKAMEERPRDHPVLDGRFIRRKKIGGSGLRPFEKYASLFLEMFPD